jgi:hypothetical protein
MRMQERQTLRLASRSVTQDITGCDTNINNFLLEYAVIGPFVKIPHVS